MPIILSSAALVIALLALLRSGSQSGTGDDANRDIRRQLDSQVEDLQAVQQRQGRFLVMIAAGEPVTPGMIEEGMTFHGVNPQRAQQIVDQDKGFLLDIRTPAETASGVIPGATWIPMDQLEERLGELPRDRPLVIY